MSFVSAETIYEASAILESCTNDTIVSGSTLIVLKSISPFVRTLTSRFTFVSAFSGLPFTSKTILINGTFASIV